MARSRIKLPKTAVAGEIIRIKAQVNHPMESGHRRDKEGTVIPQKIVNTFQCMFNETVVFSCDFDTSVASNPYLEFRAKVDKSGTFTFLWTEDDGTETEVERSIEVAD